MILSPNVDDWLAVSAAPLLKTKVSAASGTRHRRGWRETPVSRPRLPRSAGSRQMLAPSLKGGPGRPRRASRPIQAETRRQQNRLFLLFPGRLFDCWTSITTMLVCTEHFFYFTFNTAVRTCINCSAVNNGDECMTACTNPPQKLKNNFFLC